MCELHDSILERCPLLLPLFRKLTIEIHCERTNQRSCDLHVEPPAKVHVLEIQQYGRSSGSSSRSSSSSSNVYGNGSGKGDAQDSGGLDKIIGLGEGQGQGPGQRLVRKSGYTPSTYALSSSLTGTTKSPTSTSSIAAYVNLSTTSDTPKARLTGAAVAQSINSSGNNSSSTSFSRKSNLLQQEWQT